MYTVDSKELLNKIRIRESAEGLCNVCAPCEAQTT